MAKPEVEVSGPSVVYAGGSHQLEFEITAEDEIRVDYVEARVVGRQGWEVGGGNSRVTRRVTLPSLVSRFMGRGTLPAGKTRFTMQFQLPRDMAPTHQIAPAWAQCELSLRISIPWWFDHKYRWDLAVRVPPPEVVQRTPVVMRSTPTTSDRPRIEVSLPSTRLIAGEGVEGAVAVFHLDDKKPREIDLQLVPELTLIGRTSRTRTGHVLGWTVTLPPGTAGQAMPFRIGIPRTIVPSFFSVSHQLRWSLTARSGSLLGTKVAIEIPLEIVDQSAASTTARLAAPPRLADERVGAVFARFAGAHGWRGYRLGDDDPDDARVAVERELGAETLRLTYAYREDGTFLVAQIATPSLGLGLSVTPSSTLRHVFWKDIEVGIPAWDRDHLVVARFPEQTIPVLEAVVPTLVKLPVLGTLARWTDDVMVFESSLPSVDNADLIAAGTALTAVASALAAARFRIAPPPNLAVELPAWQALAHSLGAELGLGDLSIAGKLGHVPVTAHLEFDRDDRTRAVAVVASAGDPEHASAAARAIRIELARPAADALGSTQLAEAVVAQLTRWSTDIVDLRVADAVATARLPIAAPTEAEPRVAVSAERVKELIHDLAGVLAAIDPGAGPYR